MTSFKFKVLPVHFISVSEIELTIVLATWKIYELFNIFCANEFDTFSNSTVFLDNFVRRALQCLILKTEHSNK